MAKYLTCEEVANIYRVNVATVWRWCREGKLNTVRIGRVYRVDEESLKNIGG